MDKMNAQWTDSQIQKRAVYPESVLAECTVD